MPDLTQLAQLELSEDGAVFQADGLELTLHSVGAPGTSLADQGVTLERHGEGLRAARTLRAGQTGGVVLESMGGAPRRLPPEEVQRLADETAAFWRGWLDRSTYTGRWREMVARSAMTLKLMTYAPTGAVVASTGRSGWRRSGPARPTWRGGPPSATTSTTRSCSGAGTRTGRAGPR